jgi:putative transposase
MERASEVFKKGPFDAEQALVEKEAQIAELERKVDQLTIEVVRMKINLENYGANSSRMELVEHHHEHLTVKRQCELLSVNPSSAYRNRRLPDRMKKPLE